MPRVDTALPQLKRGLGSPALFGIVQGFVGASIYFAVGVVAARALGLTWLVFLAGALFFALLVPCYVEGTSLHQERGGATVIARYAFNELWSFIAGWAICLDYLILIALTAYATTDYVAVFWEPVDSGAPEFLVAAAVVIAVAVINVRGSSPRRFERAALIVLADLALQLVVLAFGFALLFEPEVLTNPAAIAGSPSLEDLMFAFPLVLVAFSGIDASSGLAGQVAIGRRGLKRLMAVRLIGALRALRGPCADRVVGAAAAAGNGVGRGPDGGRGRGVLAGVGARAACATCWPSRAWRSSPRPATRRCSASHGSATRWRSTARSRRWSATCTRNARRRSW